ncbi:MAG: hypothetical protein HOW97_35065, partial [Catenulispora sp.]|nr:hypothetical protein [Catenulispora sp.]
MRVSPRIERHADRVLGSAKASELLAGAARLDEADFDGQDLDRIAAAMVVMAARGVPVDSIMALARTDWRDLLMAGGL